MTIIFSISLVNHYENFSIIRKIDFWYKHIKKYQLKSNGEKIAHIDANVFKSLDYVESGTKDLGIATTHHDKANSTKRKIVGTLVAAGVIAGAVTFGIKKLG
jgi:hypothetical protein